MLLNVQSDLCGKPTQGLKRCESETEVASRRIDSLIRYNYKENSFVYIKTEGTY
jgi:hypothetical protein